jgi:hypothetical protein
MNCRQSGDTGKRMLERSIHKRNYLDHTVSVDFEADQRTEMFCIRQKMGSAPGHCITQQTSTLLRMTVQPDALYYTVL